MILVWVEKNGKGQSSSSSLFSLPPTKEAFIENVKRAHLQSMIWRDLKVEAIEKLEPRRFGVEKRPKNKILSPIVLPDISKAAPAYILELL